MILARREELGYGNLQVEAGKREAWILHPSAAERTIVIVCRSNPSFSCTSSGGIITTGNLCKILTKAYAASVSAKSTTSSQHTIAIIAKVILDKYQNKELTRRQILFPLFGDGIFTQDGPAWKHSRELLRPQFSHKQYQDLEVFREHVDNLISNIPANGGVVDLQPLFFRFTLDTTTAFLFGESVYSLVGAGTSAGKSAFADAFDIAQAYVAKRSRLVELYWLISGKEFYGSCVTVHKFADDILSRGLDAQGDERERHSRYVFLDVVAKDSGDRTSLRQQMINILVAGRDTTACLLSWTFRLLVRYPHVLSKLQEEISSITGGSSEMTRADLQKMAYLNNILKESKPKGDNLRVCSTPANRGKTPSIALRLYPPVPVNTRTALRTTFLPTGGGPDRRSPVLIHRGSPVAYSVYSLHRRADLYGEDAEEFRPERWEEDLGLFRDETTAKWGYLPFNGGPRICLGSTHAKIYFKHIQSKLAFPSLSHTLASPTDGNQTSYL
ncbi:MAG: hypothetical protein M1840_001514 [Geoglossum simile]|nr:MAG: hypothetical protein M1840_001514 [Geoglossum simile]